jgi:LysM repeat protein
MKKISWLIACLFSLTATAQEKLVLMGKPPDLYVVHTVNGQESMQDISNQFGQSVTKLSTYNGLNPIGVLPKATQVKIPLTQYNLIHVKGDENSAPVYHIIQQEDNLYRLSKAYKVTMATLREWNNLTTDIVKNGQAVLIGYMVNARIMPQKKVTDADAGESNTVKPVVPIEKIPAKKEPVSHLSKTAEPVAEKKNIVPESTKTVKLPVSIPEKKEESSVYIAKEGDEGYFAQPYIQHPKELSQQFHSGDAATFKTISGWTDRKYYVLINDIAPETIVRITAPNNKSVCAKVLGPLQETKGGSGLLLRLSNSAASALGIIDTRFTVTVTHFE